MTPISDAAAASGASADTTMAALTRTLRYVVALLGSPIIARALTMPIVATFSPSDTAKLDAGAWWLVKPLVLAMLLKGLLVGVCAGLVAGRRARLTAAIADFVPLTVLVGMSIVRQQDVIFTSPHYGLITINWAVTGLAPALMGGQIAASISGLRARAQAAAH